MASADQLLFQQANQTMALMQAIGQNTQRAFQNRAQVQQAELSAGLQVAGQMEQYRVNDARIRQLDQTMQLQLERHEWDRRNQEFSDKLRPLEYQARELSLQNQFRANAEQRMSPFLSDIKGEFQQLIIDNPEFAGEAQTIYAQTIDGILNRSISDPSIDLSTEIEKGKGQLRSWMKSKTKPDMMPALKSFGIAAANTVLGTAFDPTKPLKEAEKRVNLDRDDVSRAATIYAGFGGNPKDFVLKYDPDEKARVDTAYRTSMAIGDLPPIEILERMPQEMQTSLLKRVEQKQNINNLNDAARSITAQITEFAKQDRDLREASQPAVNESAIASLKTQLDFINKERAKVMGVDMLPDSGQLDGQTSTVPSNQEILDQTPIDPALQDVQSKTQRQFLQNDFDGVAGIIRKINPDADLEVAKLGEIFASNPDAVTKGDIAKLISKVTPENVEALASLDWFYDHIKEMNLDYDDYGDGRIDTKLGRAMKVLTTDSRPFMEAPWSGSSKRVFSTKRDRLWTDKEKEEARKVLKSELPDILFNYLNQNR